ncbi:MAG: hypothetical protein IPP71_08060 [Bacteroidetes bacterium]|nr:hypothetical protein [Bacteroidota bacterium]
MSDKLNKIPNNDEEALRFENEFLQAKIAAEYGGMNGGNENTPPEILNAFLKNIIEFEESMKDAKEVLLYDYIGRPEFKKEEELTNEQVKVELELMNDILFVHNIAYDNIHPAEDRQLYKFVTEELFQQTISDRPISGMTTNFIYEEFHPYHVADTYERCEEFIKMFFSDTFKEKIQSCFPKSIKNLAELCNFHNAFEEFRNVNYKFSDAVVEPDQCVRKATISFDAVTSVGTKPIHFSGEAVFELEYKYDWWSVNSARFRGWLKMNKYYSE